jgi:hypothetical protein
MQGAAICGYPVRARLSSERPAARPSTANSRGDRRPDRPFNRRERFETARAAGNRNDRPEPAEASARRGKVKLSPAARARLLDTADLSRFELENHRSGDRVRRSDNRRDNRSDRRGNRKNADRGSKRRDRH